MKKFKFKVDIIQSVIFVLVASVFAVQISENNSRLDVLEQDKKEASRAEQIALKADSVQFDAYIECTKCSGRETFIVLSPEKFRFLDDYEQCYYCSSCKEITNCILKLNNITTKVN